MRKSIFLILGICLAITIGCTESTKPAPVQIDLVGIIPGRSVVEVNSFADSEPSPGWTNLIVGGFKLPCHHQYSDGKLSQMDCRIGGDWTDESNEVIHNVLLKGFIQKFGPPQLMDTEELNTAMGVKYTNSNALWIDQSGNTLSLIKYVGAVNKGSLTLNSAEYERFDKEADLKAEKARKF